jgi:hypothetical protein
MKIIILFFICLFLTGCQKVEQTSSEEIGENASAYEEVDVNDMDEETSETQHVFLADAMDLPNISNEFTVDTLNCRNRKTVSNQFIIDENHMLWGCGYNEYGQLGIGKEDTIEKYYSEPVKIAENVVSVDASDNGYFAVYLTKDGELYGMGSNRLGLLGQPYEEYYSDSAYRKVTEPVLLMQDVVYASAGMKSILALKQDGTVWWWGEYSSTYSTQYHTNSYEYYWKSEEDEGNPVKILYNEPKMILEDCIYAVTGDWHGAAITSTGELYTWGLNIFGECGVEPGKDDFVRNPIKVLDDVDMVWVERIDSRGSEQEIYDTSVRRNQYGFNIFVQLKDGTFLAAGKDLGNSQKTIEVTGDIIQQSTETYSDSFVPIVVKEYSEDDCRTCLNELQWGMSMSEVEDFLAQGNMEYFKTAYPIDGADNVLIEKTICVNDNSYLLYFDENQCLYQIDLQVGGSRNGKFLLGMTLEEVQGLLECELVLEPEVYAQSRVYRTLEAVEGVYYTFVFDNNDGALIIVKEAGNLQ